MTNRDATPPTNDPSGASLATAALLNEPVRGALYAFVASRDEPVDRDEAASAVGVGRPLAAFHLDRLVAAGLLDVEFRRRSGRTGPGAGRPAKFYLRRRDQDVSIDLPARSYDVAAEILATGIERTGRAKTAVFDAARERGQAMAAGAGARGLLPMLETQG